MGFLKAIANALSTPVEAQEGDEITYDEYVPTGQPGAYHQEIETKKVAARGNGILGPYSLVRDTRGPGGMILVGDDEVKQLHRKRR